MMMQSRYNGFASFDAMLSVVPVMLMMLFLLNLSSLSASSVDERMHRQEVFDKLVSIADYSVKSGAVMRVDDIRYPNWVDGALLTDSYAEDLRVRASLGELYISLREPDDAYQACIYRLVVTGDEKALKRLHVCGG
jgi:hypothetical protein